MVRNFVSCLSSRQIRHVRIRSFVICDGLRRIFGLAGPFLQMEQVESLLIPWMHSLMLRKCRWRV